MKNMWTKTLVAAVALALFSLPAMADTCATGGSGELLVPGSGSDCTVELTQTNTTELEGIVVTATVANDGSTVWLTFELTNNPVTNDFQGFIAAGWNGPFATSLPAWSGTPGGGSWSLDQNPPSVLDGFGSFTAPYGRPGNPQGQTSITFGLPGDTSSFDLNSAGNWFAVHAQFSDNCSGWVGGPEGASGQSSNAGCTPIPEPATLTLLGTGLLGLAGAVRRRLAR